MERDCESELSKLNTEQNACIYHFGASVIHGQRSNILRLLFTQSPDMVVKCADGDPVLYTPLTVGKPARSALRDPFQPETVI